MHRHQHHERHDRSVLYSQAHRTRTRARWGSRPRTADQNPAEPSGLADGAEAPSSWTLLGILLIAALAAISARETYRININDLGKPDAVPMAKADYEKRRAEAALAA